MYNTVLLCKICADMEKRAACGAAPCVSPCNVEACQRIYSAMRWHGVGSGLWKRMSPLLGNSTCRTTYVLWTRWKCVSDIHEVFFSSLPDQTDAAHTTAKYGTKLYITEINNECNATREYLTLLFEQRERRWNAAAMRLLEPLWQTVCKTLATRELCLWLAWD